MRIHAPFNSSSPMRKGSRMTSDKFFSVGDLCRIEIFSVARAFIPVPFRKDLNMPTTCSPEAAKAAKITPSSHATAETTPAVRSPVISGCTSPSAPSKSCTCDASVQITPVDHAFHVVCERIHCMLHRRINDTRSCSTRPQGLIL